MRPLVSSKRVLKVREGDDASMGRRGGEGKKLAARQEKLAHRRVGPGSGTEEWRESWRNGETGTETGVGRGELRHIVEKKIEYRNKRKRKGMSYSGRNR